MKLEKNLEEQKRVTNDDLNKNLDRNPCKFTRDFFVHSGCYFS